MSAICTRKTKVDGPFFSVLKGMGQWIDEEYPPYFTPVPLQWSAREIEMDRFTYERIKRMMFPSKPNELLYGTWHYWAEELAKIRCPVKKHLAKKYNWRNVRMVLDVDYSVVCSEFSLGDGIYLWGGGMSPNNQHNQMNKINAFYLTWLYRKDGQWTGKGKNPFLRLRGFAKHLEQQEGTKVQALYMRPAAPLLNKEMDHLRMTDYVPSMATTEDLKRAYASIGFYESAMKDGATGYYWTYNWKPKDPAPNLPTFKWPRLLQRRQKSTN